jgi:hypothetical protein
MVYAFWCIYHTKSLLTGGGRENSCTLTLPPLELISSRLYVVSVWLLLLKILIEILFETMVACNDGGDV